MAGYAAAMDASLSQEPKEEPAAREPVTTATAGTTAAAAAGAAAAIGELNSSGGGGQPQDPLEALGEGPSGAEAAGTMGAGVEDWESQTGEDPDADKASLSLCMSETGSKKGKGEAEGRSPLFYVGSDLVGQIRSLNYWVRRDRLIAR